MKKYLYTLLAVVLVGAVAFIGLPLQTLATSNPTHDVDSTKVVNGFFASPTNTWTSGATSASATLGVLTCDIWQDVAGSGTVGSASYNGSAITAVTSINSGSMYSYIGYIVSPVSGAKTVSVTVSGNIDGFKCSFSSYIGTAVVSPVDTSTTGVTGTVPYTSVSKAITTGVANALVIATLSKFGVGALTVGGGQTTIQNDVTGSISGAAGYQAVTAAGVVTPSWTMGSNSNDWSMVVVSFKPAPDVVTGGGAGYTIVYEDN